MTQALAGKLEGFTEGPIKKPPFIIVYGPDGVGKTTLAASFPKPIFIEAEQGSAKFNVARFYEPTWTGILRRVHQIKTSQHDFQTLVLDTLDAMEFLMWEHIMSEHKKDAIEETFGGYGKWVNGVTSEFSRLIKGLEILQADRGMQIVCLAHVQTKILNDPMQNVPYDRHGLKLHEKAAAKWREKVDAVLFATFVDTVFKIDNKDKKGKTTQNAGPRKMYCTRRAAFDAKNRLGLPDELPLDYATLAEAIAKGQPDSLEHIQKDIAELGQELATKDQAKFDKMQAAVVAAGNDLSKLNNIRNYLRVLVEE